VGIVAKELWRHENRETYLSTVASNSHRLLRENDAEIPTVLLLLGADRGRVSDADRLMGLEMMSEPDFYHTDGLSAVIKMCQ
jgi:hypothetical protein